MSVYVIVDDADSNINYSPAVTHDNGVTTSAEAESNGWFVGGLGALNEFLMDTSGTGKASSTMSYQFTGNSITVFGTTPGLNEGNAYTSTEVSFSVDGSVISNNTYPVPSTTRRHIPFFVSPDLSSSSNTHTLEIEVISAASTTNQSNFLIDYLIYNATVNSTIPSPEKQTSWVFVDDQSEYLDYSQGGSGWSGNVINFPGTGDFNLTDAAFNSSVMGPTSSSSTVTLNFTGVSTIRAYAMLIANTSSGSLGSYTLDGSPSQLITPSSGTAYPIYNFEILTATPSSGDSHTLEIQAEDANAFYLDYVLLQTGNAFVTQLVAVSGSGSNSSDGSGNGGSSGSGSGSSGSNNGDEGGSSGGNGGGSSGTNVGAIAGGVVGGVVALAAIGLAIFFWLRRRRDKNGYASKGRFDVAAEDRYAHTEGYSDVHGYEDGEGQGQGMPMGMYQRQRAQSNYTTTATPFIPNLSPNTPSFSPSPSTSADPLNPNIPSTENSGYISPNNAISSQSRKLDMYTHAGPVPATASTSIFPPNTHLADRPRSGSEVSSSAVGASLGASTGIGSTPVLLERDSGLRGFEEPVRLPPQYTPE